MNRKTYFIIALLLTIIVGSGAYLITNQDSNTDQKTDVSKTTVAENDTVNNTSKQLAGKPGQYLEYSESSFTANSDSTRLLFFHAPWCPQCRSLDKDILENKVPEGVIIFKVDYDSNLALRKKYGVTLQTTIVKVDGDGAIMGKYVPYENPTLSNVISNIL